MVDYTSSIACRREYLKIAAMEEDKLGGGPQQLNRVVGTHSVHGRGMCGTA